MSSDEAWAPQPVLPRGPDVAAARKRLAAELEQRLPCTASRDVLLAALRDVWELAERWRERLPPGAGDAAWQDMREVIEGRSL